MSAGVKELVKILKWASLHLFIILYKCIYLFGLEVLLDRLYKNKKGLGQRIFSEWAVGF